MRLFLSSWMNWTRSIAQAARGLKGQCGRGRQVADGRWRTETALAFRYLRFRGTGVSGVKVVPIGRPMEEAGSFASPNPRHERLREVGVRTTRLCALDFLVDSLKRDRMPWGGDLAVSFLADAYVFGDAEIARRSLSALDAYEGDVNGIVTYSMWLIASHDLYQRHFGDRAFLDARWWRVKGRIEDLLSRTDERGFVVKGLDWGGASTGPDPVPTRPSRRSGSGRSTRRRALRTACGMPVRRTTGRSRRACARRSRPRTVRSPFPSLRPDPSQEKGG